MASEKVTLASLAAQMNKGFALIEKRFATADTRVADLGTKIEKGLGSADQKFAALADDIADIKRDMASKGQIITLHTQITAIETDIRSMKHDKFVTRVADLEDKVFGKTRA